MRKDAQLCQVAGRCTEPIALYGQSIVTQQVMLSSGNTAQLEGRLVIAVDESGCRCLKRFQPHGNNVALESLNPDGPT